MASAEEKAEQARVKVAEEQAQADRQRELSRRQAREEAAKSSDNLIVHGPASD